MEIAPQDPRPGRLLTLRRPDTCRACDQSLAVGTRARYDRTEKTVLCLECCSATAPSDATATVHPGPPMDPTDDAHRGVAGRSARLEHQRRRANDQDRLRRRWGRLGGLAVLLSDDKPSTKAWATGAVGEERLRARLDTLPDPIVVLHDRRIPGSRANLDHLVVAPSGVWVIDAKRYAGRPHLVIDGGILRPRTERLLVGRRDCTTLIDSMHHQTGLVSAVLDEVPVTGALCFVDADWPLIGGTFTTRGVHVARARHLVERIAAAEGDLDVTATAARLWQVFRPA